MAIENIVKSENQPLVSVGIPTYNRPEGLKRIIECIIGCNFSVISFKLSDIRP